MSRGFATPPTAVAVIFPALAMARNTTTKAGGQVGWVSSGNGRSTSEILWSCISILLVCTWKCVHLNIPSLEERRAKWLKWHGVPYWPERPLLRKWLRKIKWMGIAVIAPEFGVAMAVNQYLEARKSVRAMKEACPRDEWTMAHAFYADMGGFVVTFLPPLPGGSEDLGSTPDPTISSQHRASTQANTSRTSLSALEEMPPTLPSRHSTEALIPDGGIELPTVSAKPSRRPRVTQNNSAEGTSGYSQLYPDVGGLVHDEVTEKPLQKLYQLSSYDLG
jgi:hypothetical protein